MIDEPGSIMRFAGSEVDPDARSSPWGRPADYQSGIVFAGPWAELSGFSEHARRCALALATAGEPVQLRDNGMHLLRHDEVGEQLLARVRPLIDTTIAKPWAQVEMLVPSEEALMRRTMHQFLSAEEYAPVLKSKVLSTVWERTSITEAAAAALNRFGQAWVACRANAEMLVRCGVDAARVKVVPVPHWPDDPLLKLRNRERRPGPVKFIAVGKWEPRKEHRNIIGAFLLAFRPGDEVQLFLKTSGLVTKIKDYPQSPGEALAQWLADERVKARGWDEENYKRHLFVIDKQLPESGIVALHAMADVYVSLSRGEGFGMPDYDAKLAGNLLLYTPSGGLQDFAAPDDIVVPMTGTVPAHSFYLWPRGAEYLDYDLDAAVAGMQQAAAVIRAGYTRAGHDMTSFLAENVGRRMLEHLNEMVPAP